ncbi:MAG: DUF2089 domain-containing protein [Chitinispirillaceae bacterium]
MEKQWHELDQMVGEREIVVNRVTVRDTGIALEGEFVLPPLAKLSYDDQVFVGMFIRCHGSIKEMEQAFGVSYPTVKSRLSRIGEKLGFVQGRKVNHKEELLAKLERGEISVSAALEQLEGA